MIFNLERCKFHSSDACRVRAKFLYLWLWPLWPALFLCLFLMNPSYTSCIDRTGPDMYECLMVQSA